MRPDDYRQAKVAFVSDLEGGSVSHINSVCATALSTYAVWIILHDRWLRDLDPRDSLKVPLVEFAVLILPLLLALTILANRPLLLNALLCCTALLLASAPLRPRSSSRPPPLSPSLGRRRNQTRLTTSPRGLFVQPFITSYRAIMMVMTVLCILAVDFPAFPREFAKAETWGTSLMDLGVGSFVFSLGLVSALPLLRRAVALPDPTSSPPTLSVSTTQRHRPAASVPSSYATTILTSLRKSLPVIALGMVRVIMVKGVEYPEHVTEYGVHWNFFFTLALLPVLAAPLERHFFARATATATGTTSVSSPDQRRGIRRLDMHAIGLGVGVVHQLLLSLTPLQTWGLTAERTGLLSQNKEGLVSIPGYLSIYLVGVATGLYTLPPTPTFFRLMTARLDCDSGGSGSKTPACVVRRRLEAKRAKALDASGGKGLRKAARKKAEWLASAAANLTYVVWVSAFNTTFLCLYLVLHLVLASPSGSASASASRLGDENSAFGRGSGGLVGGGSGANRDGTKGGRTMAAPEEVRGGEGEEAPAIFEAINRNGLVVFLAANLLTGLVNLSVETMYASDPVAVVVLVAYAASVVGCAWVLRTKRVKLS
ncbi:hypothetical protein JCM3774_003393 [Rhodotorula dairenensis]